ncbi:MAG: hypothetical protein KGI68_12640 [Alphaproteobacteria bacterium]|nr:hypothetical protein [Alphaproteobacteria bacterium]MDE2162889.1 hypothetical protein [Alphaproteobacteria bacterium]
MSLQTGNDLTVVTDAAVANDVARQRGWPVLYDATCRCRHEKLNELHALWRSMAEHGGIPHRREMTARLLQPYMRDLLLFERVGNSDGRHYRVRLMGSTVARTLEDMTGRLLDEVIPEHYLPRWYVKIDVALATGAPLRMVARGDTFDKSFMVGEYLCLPLLADDGERRLVLAAAHFDSTHPWSAVMAEECGHLGLPPLTSQEATALTID